MRNITHQIVLFAAVLFLATACTSDNSIETESAAESAANMITMTQFEAEEMQLGKAESMVFSTIFKSNGQVKVSPQGKAEVYSFIPGSIKSIEVREGNFVKKGQVLLVVTSTTIIDWQKEYLESLATMNSLDLDYQRVKTLYEKKVSSQKDFLLVQSEYNSLKAKLAALLAKFKVLNVSVERLESGNLISDIEIRSPIDGNISFNECAIGQFVDSEDLLFNIVDNAAMQLHFMAFQEQYNSLQIGQKVNILNVDNRGRSIVARLESKGQTIDPTSKGILCVASIDGQQSSNLIDGMYFQVEVELGSDSLMAVPDEAIVKLDQRYFVFALNSHNDSLLGFELLEVEVGKQYEGFTQIISPADLPQILVKGTYYFNGEIEE